MNRVEPVKLRCAPTSVFLALILLFTKGRKGEESGCVRMYLDAFRDRLTLYDKTVKSTRSKHEKVVKL